MPTLDFGRQTALSAAVALALTVGAEKEVLAQDEPALEEITVTGTRIVRRDYSAMTPILTVGGETLTERTNIGIETALNQLPQFNTAGTQSQLSPANTPFPQASAAPGAATVDLRGIGWVHLAVDDLNAAARLFRAAFGWDDPAPADSGAAGSGMAHFSGTPVVLSTPARAGLGDSPAGFVLRSHDLRASARRFPRAQRGTWLGRDALWLDPDALGGRYLGISEDATE